MFMHKFSLEGRVGIVTGGGQGLGRVYCQAFAEAGADVTIAEINVETGQETADHVRHLGRRSLLVETDVRRRNSVVPLVEQALQAFGKIDFLVNNAGLARVCPAVDLPKQEWRDIFTGISFLALRHS